jgi:hypothetical protein
MRARHLIGVVATAATFLVPATLSRYGVTIDPQTIYKTAYQQTTSDQVKKGDKQEVGRVYPRTAETGSEAAPIGAMPDPFSYRWAGIDELNSFEMPALRKWALEHGLTVPVVAEGK